MTAALTQLAQDDVKYQVLPITWIRVMHPKGSGYNPMSDAVIDAVVKYSAAGIGTFCGVAAQQGVQDPNSESIVRTYNERRRYQVTLSMDWPPRRDTTNNMERNCIDGTTVTMDKPFGLEARRNQRGNILYYVVPSIDQGYTPGTCTIHLQEDDFWSGTDSPGFERHWDFQPKKLTLDDGAGAIIGTSPPGSPIDAGDGNAFSWSTKLLKPLVMTPEAQGNPAAYIQFTIGTESWQSSQKDDTKMPFCNVGGFNSAYGSRCKPSFPPSPSPKLACTRDVSY